MKSPSVKISSVEAYIKGFPPSTRKMLEQVRSIILKHAPKAEEAISYNMPGYKQNGVLVYFAGYERHIGFYPMPDAIEAFKKEIAVYKSAKGSVQFPLDKPLPVKLIADMVKFRVLQNEQKPEKPARKRTIQKS